MSQEPSFIYQSKKINNKTSLLKQWLLQLLSMFAFVTILVLFFLPKNPPYWFLTIYIGIVAFNAWRSLHEEKRINQVVIDTAGKTVSFDFYSGYEGAFIRTIAFAQLQVKIVRSGWFTIFRNRSIPIIIFLTGKKQVTLMSAQKDGFAADSMRALASQLEILTSPVIKN